MCLLQHKEKSVLLIIITLNVCVCDVFLTFVSFTYLPKTLKKSMECEKLLPGSVGELHSEEPRLSKKRNVGFTVKYIFI